MSDPKLIHPAGWMKPSGYSFGVSASGRVVAIAGQTGLNPVNGAIESADFAAQAAQALRNIVAVLRAELLGGAAFVVGGLDAGDAG